MRQWRFLNESRNIGFSAIVSARALKVATFISLSGLFHQPGIKPQRMGKCWWLTTASIVVVGQML